MNVLIRVVAGVMVFDFVCFKVTWFEMGVWCGWGGKGRWGVGRKTSSCLKMTIKDNKGLLYSYAYIVAP